jgi:SAM-dependent methyltransferase
MNKTIKNILNQHLFQPVWYSIVINPYFIVRRGLLKKVKAFAAADFSAKNILDLGCGLQPYKSLFKSNSYMGIDIEDGGHDIQAKIVDKFYDGQTIPYPDNNFETVICTEVLEHVQEPIRLLSEIKRVLKPGGEILLSMPFVWYEHEIPYDFNRFTSYQQQLIFKQAGLTITKIEGTTGVFRTCGQLISAFVFERLFTHNKPLKALSAVLFCFPIQVIFICLDFIFKNSWLTLNYVVVAKK